MCVHTEGEPLEELNANKSQSISSALDFFGDNVQEDNSGIPTPGNPSETINSERKQVKRKQEKQRSRRDSSKEIKAEIK